MGSKYFGDQNYSLSSSSSSSSSRKGKKNSSDKPKQPQRGLGVAQLEKIRLHSQLGCAYLPSPPNPYASSFTQLQEDTGLQPPRSSSLPSSSSLSYSSSSSPTYGFQGHHGVMIGLPDVDRTNITYADSQSNSIARWNPGNASYGARHFVQPSVTRSFLEPAVQGSQNKKDRNESESSNSEEIDLELRLSL